MAPNLSLPNAGLRLGPGDQGGRAGIPVVDCADRSAAEYVLLWEFGIGRFPVILCRQRLAEFSDGNLPGTLTESGRASGFENRLPNRHLLQIAAQTTAKETQSRQLTIKEHTVEKQ